MKLEHFENQEHEWESALSVNDGAEAVQVNPKALERLMSLRRGMKPLEHYVDGILNGDRVVLSEAITLIESTLPEHQKIAQKIISACLPHSGKALRLGITGVPGAGKSTFIEALGTELANKGHKIAVLAIDPSSQRSKGSILGDKTRMEELSVHPNVFIRPSASAGTLGGVARKTRESAIVCEAAGFDTVFIETVGVGQSETAVCSMVDFFLLILIGGAGDELQGIKRGIMEMADGIVVNKADGDNVMRAERAMAEIKNAVRLLPKPESGLEVETMTCSALTHLNIEKVWDMIYNNVDAMKKSGFLQRKRIRQDIEMMYETINNVIHDRFYNDAAVKERLAKAEDDILNKKATAYKAAMDILGL